MVLTIDGQNGDKRSVEWLHKGFITVGVTQDRNVALVQIPDSEGELLFVVDSTEFRGVVRSCIFTILRVKHSCDCSGAAAHSLESPLVLSTRQLPMVHRNGGCSSRLRRRRDGGSGPACVAA